MARRKRQPTAAVDAVDVPPAELLGRTPRSPSEVDQWVGRNERAPEGFGFPDWFWRIVAAAGRKRDARRKWCEERGYSAAMTFAGWNRPDPGEQVAGYVNMPPGGPIRHRRNDRG